MNKYSVGLTLGIGFASILISYSYFKNCNIYNKEKNVKQNNNENNEKSKDNSINTNKILKIDKIFIKEKDLYEKNNNISNIIVKNILNEIIDDVIDKSEKEKKTNNDKKKNKINFSDKWTIIN